MSAQLKIKIAKKDNELKQIERNRLKNELKTFESPYNLLTKSNRLKAIYAYKFTELVMHAEALKRMLSFLSKAE